MVMTKRGIYHNLKESEYAISNGEIAFFFSSRFYLNKYLEEYKDFRKEFRTRIARAMVVTEMNTDLLADIHLYKEIEKRGFRVIFFNPSAKFVVGGRILEKEGDVTWQSLHQFALVKMTEKNTLDWSEMLVQK